MAECAAVVGRTSSTIHRNTWGRLYSNLIGALVLGDWLDGVGHIFAREFSLSGQSPIVEVSIFGRVASFRCSYVGYRGRIGVAGRRGDKFTILLSLATLRLHNGTTNETHAHFVRERPNE